MSALNSCSLTAPPNRNPSKFHRQNISSHAPYFVPPNLATPFRLAKSAVSCKVMKNIFGSGESRPEPPPNVAKPPPAAPPTVEVDNDASADQTLLTIIAENRTGLLQAVAGVFKAMGVQISKANLNLENGFVVEKIFVTDSKGEKITDAESVDNIRRALSDALERKPAMPVEKYSKGVGARVYRGDLGFFEVSEENKARAELLFRLMDQYARNDVESIQKDILDHVEYTVARSRFSFDDFEAYQATAHSVRDRLIESWNDTHQYFRAKDPKRLFYLSLEFLMGRSLSNSINNLGIRDQYAEALKQLGFNLETLAEKEGDAALGNGGLARLSACLMDSLATLDFPAWGYGLRYQYGLFRQIILDGFQHEQLDYWLNFGNPWEIERVHISYPVKFYGKVEEEVVKGRRRRKWIPGEMVEAVAYDNPIPGYDTGNTINLRLWGAKPSGESELESYSTGDYVNAIINRQRAETISSVLYPDDRSYQGKELRLKQQYFFVSASLQDIMRRFKDFHSNIDQFPDKVALQLNDTHPSIAIPELMRMLVDEENVEWNRAWEIIKKVFSLTNHTVLPEALEKIPVELMGSLLPRHLQIIYDINFFFLEDLRKHIASDYARLARMSIIEEGAVKSICMANLSIVTCHSVNGVSRMHSEILQTTVFKDFYDIWPHKFQSITNGVTQRRWLAICNPGLRGVITKWLGTEAWIKDLDLLMGLRQHATNPRLQNEWRKVHRLNKSRLAEYIEEISGLKVSIDAMFDVQVKRIHEYKRQFLNVLSIIHRYDCIKRMTSEERRKVVPRVCLIGGKAAPGYEIAKKIIKLIHAVGEKINNDPDIGNLLKLVFVPDYNVSVAEVVIPASDLSQHISTAGHEASGTGSMKFLMNGCLILGTLDGSTIEIAEEIGDENLFTFGAKVHEVPILRAQRRDFVPPREFTRVIRMIRDGYFGFKEYFQSLCDTVDGGGDFYLLGNDFTSYLEAQAAVDRTFVDQENWTRMSILSTAGSGKFSTDRTIREYAEQTWGIQTCKRPC
uniref:Alpha-1,4 glucan phosphorylase n=1 Tax=Araucaria cunninghamii TaxID=56994 RepID=A0A0D6QRA2_ARACU